MTVEGWFPNIAKGRHDESNNTAKRREFFIFMTVFLNNWFLGVRGKL
jgi:hypothetical protein